MGLECKQFPELPDTILERGDRPQLFQLNEIILKACCDDPNQRYGMASDMEEDLRALQARLTNPDPTMGG